MCLVRRNLAGEGSPDQSVPATSDKKTRFGSSIPANPSESQSKNDEKYGLTFHRVSKLINKTIPTTMEVISFIYGQAVQRNLNKLIYHHKATLGLNTRRMRCEFREALTDVSVLFMYRYNYHNGEIGFYCDDGNWKTWSIAAIAKELCRSEKQIYRVMRFMKRERFLEVGKIYGKIKNDKWIAQPARKKLTPHFFITLDIDIWNKIKRAKEYLYKKQEKNQSKKVARTMQNFVSGVRETFVQNNNYVKNYIKHAGDLIGKKIKPKQQQQNISAETQRRLVALSRAAHERDPSRSLTDYFREFQAQLR